MKKLILTFSLILLIIPTIIFAGCGKTETGINMTRYFETKVSYFLYNSENRTPLTDLTLPDFLTSNHDNIKRYSSIAFTGNSAWLYKMEIESVTFEIYPSSSEDAVEFNLSITNVEHGDQAPTSASNTYSKTISINLEKDKPNKITFPVNDKIISQSSTTTFTLSFKSPEVFTNNKDFAYSVSAFSVTGHH